MRRWKARTHGLGWDLLDGGLKERLSNICYADDLMLFAKSKEEVAQMVDVLDEELRKSGSEINAGKTKVLTTDASIYLCAAPVYIEAMGQHLQMARQGEIQTYLVKMLAGNPRSRGPENLSHRMSIAWMKYHLHRQTLLNRKICLGLRMRLFVAVVTPAALYSLSTTPLTTECLRKLDVMQRKMLRNIVGWTHSSGESWEEKGRAMKDKLQTAISKFGLESWSATLQAQKEILCQRTNLWTVAVQAWHPHAQANPVRNGILGSRRRGHPPMRWNDGFVRT